MSARVDRVNLIVTINGDKAKKKLGELENEAASVRTRMKELSKATKGYEAAAKKLKNPNLGAKAIANAKLKMDALKASHDEYQKNAKRLEVVKTEIQSLHEEIGSAALTQKQLNKRLKELKRSRENISPGTAEFKRLNREIAKTEKHLVKIQYQSRQVGKAWENVRGNFKKGLGIATAYFGFTYIISQIERLASKNIELSDSLSDVRKTTGLTDREVRKLNRDLKKIDTRTSQEALLALATTAGRLGIEGSRNIRAFVETADQIDVALKEDLGDGAIRQIGKLIDIFKIDQDFTLEESMLKVGSAINELGASSTASEAYLVDFSKRLAGIAPGAKISLQDILGLAATLDVLGQTVETSATAMGQLIVNLGKDIPEFSKLAGLSIKDFSTLLEQDANQALIKVLQGAKSTKGGLEGMVKTLQNLGVDGARATSVIGVLSNNIDELEKQQRIANDSFNEGISLTQEFNIKNENLAAKIEKLKKKFDKLVSTDGFRDFMATTVDWASDFLDVLKAMPNFVEQNTVQLTALGVALLSLKWKKSAADINLMLANLNNQVIQLEASSQATNLQTIATKGAAKAWRGLTAAFRANPIGMVATAVLLVVSAFEIFKKKQVEAKEAYSEFNKELHKSTALAQHDFKQLSKLNAGTNERKKLIEELNSKYGKYLGNLLSEKSSLQDILKAQEDVNNGIKKNLILKEDKANRTKLLEEELQLRQQLQKVMEGSLLVYKKTNENSFSGASYKPITKEDIESSIGNIEKEIVELDKLTEKRLASFGLSSAEQERLNKQYQKYLKTIGKNTAPELNEEQKKKLADLLKDIQKMEEAAALRQMNTKDAEIQVIKNNYQHKIELAKGFDQEIKTLKKLRDQEIQDLDKKQFDTNQEFIEAQKQAAHLRQLESDEAEFEQIRMKYEAQFEAAKNHKGQLKELQTLMKNELEEKENEFKERDEERVRNAMEEANILEMNKTEMEIQQITNKYDTLFDLAAGHEDKIAALKKAKTKEINKAQQKQDAAELDAKKTVELAKYAAARQGFGLLKGLFEEKSIAYKAFFLAEKAAAIAEIIVNLQKEISMLGATGGPFASQFMIAARIRAATSIGVVAAQAAAEFPKFRKGGLLKGPTHEEGGLDVIHPKTGQKVLELEGDEVVLSKATVDQNPEIVRELLQASLFNGGKTELDVLRPEVVENMQQFRYGGFVDRSTPAPIQELKSTISQQGNPENESQQVPNNESNEILATAIDKLLQRLEEPLHAIYDDKQVSNISKRQALLHKIKR